MFVIFSFLASLSLPFFFCFFSSIFSRKTQFRNWENMDSALVWSASKPLGFDVNGDGVQFCFVASSSQFCEQISRLWTVKSNNRSFFTCSGEKSAVIIDRETRKLRIMGVENVVNRRSIFELLLVNFDANFSFFFIRTGQDTFIRLVGNCDESELVDAGINRIEKSQICKVVHVNFLFQTHNHP